MSYVGNDVSVMFKINQKQLPRREIKNVLIDRLEADALKKFNLFNLNHAIERGNRFIELASHLRAY